MSAARAKSTAFLVRFSCPARTDPARCNKPIRRSMPVTSDAATMLAQQPDPLRRLSQIQHRIGEVLAVARADPHRVELEFGERGVDVHRR